MVEEKKGDTQVFGEPVKEESQKAELEAEGNKVVGDKPAEGEKETPPEKTTEKEPSEEKPKAEATDEEDVKLLQDKIVKLEKRVEHEQALIGKQSNEIGEFNKLKEKLKEATTPSEKKEAKDELQEAYDELNKSFVTAGFDDTTTKLILDAQLKLTKASDAKKVRIQAKEKAKKQIAGLKEYILESGKFNVNVFEQHSDKISAKFEKFSDSHKLDDLEGCIYDAYKLVVREEAEKERKTKKPKDEEARDAEIAGQSAPSPKSKGKPTAEENAYSAENIAKAGTGRIF